MKVPVFALNRPSSDSLSRRCVRSRLLPALFASLLLLLTHSAAAALSFGRGTPTTIGCIRYSSSPDSVTITAALTAPGTITGGLAIPANRIQYDVINCDQATLNSWTIYYSPAIGPNIIGAYTPLGYITASGTIVPQGGYAYTTLFNAGFGVYTYNTGAPWTIDYEPDHITFTGVAAPAPGLPPNTGAGFLNPNPYLPSFALLFDPNLGNGLVPASAILGTATVNGQVYGPLPGNACLSIQCTNVVVETCESCILVNFSASALDTCCSNVVLQYSLPPGTCFPINSANTITVTASDSCGNKATNYFTVTVNPGPNCPPTNCITIHATNITAYTCNPCTPVAYTAYAVDQCCPGAAPTLIFNPPTGTCFPQNSSTTVQVTAYDQCGHTNTGSFTVTVLPGPDCGNTNCISLYATNIVAYTCSSCTTVPFNVNAFDQCCSNLVLSFNPPTNTCFPLNSTTTVQIKATDACGNSASKFITVTVNPGPNCPPSATNCITIYATNQTVYSCSNCAVVPYTASAYDPCCAVGATLTFNPPPGTCFPLNTTTTVTVSASDACGNGAVSSFTVTVLPGPNCPPTNCITIYATNVIVYSCSNCTIVPFNAFVSDQCCSGSSGPTVIYNPPPTTCFPLNSTTPVQVSAFDSCGNGATNFFLVTVLPGPNCGGSNPLSIGGAGAPAPGGTNYITISWPATNGQLLESSDLNRWAPIPGATNSPYVAPKQAPMKFYRLQYN